jgi:hypothetical protein
MKTLNVRGAILKIPHKPARQDAFVTKRDKFIFVKTNSTTQPSHTDVWVSKYVCLCPVYRGHLWSMNKKSSNTKLYLLFLSGTE